MLIPVIKKIVNKKDIFVERTLPVEGTIYALVGSDLKPFDHLGNCNVSHSLLNLPKDFKPYKFKEGRKYYQFGAKLGKYASKIVTAPFNGHLFKKEKRGPYYFQEVESKFTLLSGVWGKLEKISQNTSVLIKTQTKDIQLVAATSTNFSGELIVFPNPWESLEKYYLGEFSSGAGGKVIYVGNHIDIQILKEAKKYGVGAILAGSCDREAMVFAKTHNLSFGIFSGFGRVDTPDVVYDFLKTVSNRFVIFMGEKYVLRVPVPEISEKDESADSKNAFVEVVKDTKVLVLEKNFFGQVGLVDNVSGSSIFVRLPKSKNPVEIKVPNILALG